MADQSKDRSEEQPLNERLLDLLVYAPTGVALSVVEEFPRLAERGRQRLGVRVTSARAVGQFAVRAGQEEFRRRSKSLLGRTGGPGDRPGPADRPHRVERPEPPTSTPPAQATAQPPAQPPAGATVSSVPPVEPSPGIPVTPPTVSGPAPGTGTGTGPDTGPDRSVSRPVNGHVPDVSTLSIPGFDTLSASQVVQRLDGLNRAELVSVRAYEASTRGRRTILSRVDQLLDERS
jgi:hypothetical protein